MHCYNKHNGELHMKHLIIVNTHAGNGQETKAIAEKAFEGLDFHIYETTGPVIP